MKERINEIIEKAMRDNEMTYEELAKKIGTSRQNLWMKLNKKKNPNFGSIREILSALGIDLIIERKEETAEFTEENAAAFFEQVDKEQIGYTATEKLLSAMGYNLKIKTRKNEENVKKGVDKLPTRGKV